MARIHLKPPKVIISCGARGVSLYGSEGVESHLEKPGKPKIGTHRKGDFLDLDLFLVFLGFFLPMNVGGFCQLVMSQG